MTIRFDTAEFAKPQRFSEWQDALSRLFVRLDTSTDAKDDFRITVERSEIGPVMCARIRQSTGEHIRRTKQHIAQGGEDLIVLSLVTSGGMSVRQDGRETVIRAGEFAIFDANRPYDLTIGPGNSQSVLQIPRHMLQSRFGRVDDLTAISFRPEQAAAKISFDLLTSIACCAGQMSNAQGGRMAGLALDVLVLALGEQQASRAESPTAHRTHMIYLIKSFVQAHVANGDLRLTDVAQALGISGRYVNNLLAEEGTSFRRYLIDLRLERCARDLSNPIMHPRYISQIAFAHGFNDLAHFSRAFRTRYGLSPQDWRAQASRADAAGPG